MRCEGARERLRLDHNRGVFFAWLGARLSLADPRHFPKLSRFQVHSLKPAPNQSREEMLAVMRVLVARGREPRKPVNGGGGSARAGSRPARQR